jgi:phenylacetate-CoA ligase
VISVQDVVPLLPGPIRSTALTLAGYWIYHSRFNDHFFRTLSEFEASADASIEMLHEIQRVRLDKWIVRARHHVPHYKDLPPPSNKRNHFEAIQETLSTIRPLEKDLYASNVGSFIANDVPRRKLRRSHTSGTTGTALPLWHTQEALAEEYAAIWRMYRSYGVQLRDPKMSFGGNMITPFRQVKPPFWRTNYYEGQTLFSTYHLKPRNLHAYVAAIHTTPARYAQGYPSSLNLVAQALLDAGRPLPRGRLAAVFPSSERLLASHRENIEAAFCAPVANRYGSSEFAVSMTSCRLNNLHVDMEFCIVEVEVEEETDEYVRGPILVTGLAPSATPFFRYRIGDVGTRSKRPCPCGRAGDVFLDVDGRTDDYIMTPDGRLIGRLDHIFKDMHDVAEAQICQDRKEAVEIRIAPRISFNRSSEDHLMREIRRRLGTEIEVGLVVMQEIPRERNGKFRAVKSSLMGQLR